MEPCQPRRVLEIGAELGEHPVWSAAGQCLYWLDIEKQTINRFDPATGLNRAWQLAVRPGCFALQADGSALLAAQDGFYRMDFESGQAELLVPSLHDPAVMRFNDGCLDRQGRFWVNSVRVDMDMSSTADNAYYRLDGNGLARVLGDVGIPNGTAFSPDGTRMYRARTETREIFVHDYDPGTGTPGPAHLFARLPEHLGLPDGAAVDDQGGYWVALAQLPGGPPHGGAARIAPDGRLDRVIELPVPFATMVAFGGRDLSTLYIVTARLEAFMIGEVPPGAGDIYACETGFRGVPVSV